MANRYTDEQKQAVRDALSRQEEPQGIVKATGVKYSTVIQIKNEKQSKPLQEQIKVLSELSSKEEFQKLANQLEQSNPGFLDWVKNQAKKVLMWQ